MTIQLSDPRLAIPQSIVDYKNGMLSIHQPAQDEASPDQIHGAPTKIITAVIHELEQLEKIAEFLSQEFLEIVLRLGLDADLANQCAPRTPVSNAPANGLFLVSELMDRIRAVLHKIEAHKEILNRL